MRLVGIDAAWVMSRHPTALAIGELRDSRLTVTHIEPDLVGRDSVLRAAQCRGEIAGAAVDGPLIIKNATGKRPGEILVSRRYAGRGAATHASNLGLYPDADTVWLSAELCARGLLHAAAAGSPFQIECYPHAALIELFALPKRLAYKRKRGFGVEDMQGGQCQLAHMLRSLQTRSPVGLDLPESHNRWLADTRIRTLRGRSLKQNEDVLDAILCLYIAALYAAGEGGLLGSRSKGYIYVPGADPELFD